ncbi:MAG TPA: hypothetical protein VGL91_11070 [Acidobacteriota bacterium]
MICYRCGLPKTLEPQQIYIDSNLIRDKTVTLENVTIANCECGSIPVYQNFSRLLLEIKLNPQATRFKWDDKKKKWEAITGQKARHSSSANGLR